MIIPYNRKIVRKELILGSVFFILGVAFIWSEPDSIFRYGLVLLGLLHLISGFYQLRNPYLKVENGILTRVGLLPKTIKLSEVEKTRKFAGDYTLFSKGKKLKINSELVNSHQKTELTNFILSLNIPVEETPSKKYSY